MKDYQAYLFDFDGTLFDTFYSLTFVYRYAFAQVGMDCTPEQTGVFMHMSVQETCDRLGISDPAKRQAILQGVHDALDFPENLARIRIYPDVLDTLEGLKKEGKIVAVVSGNTEKHIALVLEACHLSREFAFVVGNSPLRKPKPSGDPIFEAKKHLPGLPDSAMVYIGDSLQDPETAKNGGIDGILLERKGEYPTYAGAKIATLKALVSPK
jgi:pyrophosphatase PpaX